LPALRITIATTVDGIDRPAAAARAEGYRMVDRIVADFENGASRFDGPGELLVVATRPDGEIVPVGGLNIDPFADAAERAGRDLGISSRAVSTMIVGCPASNRSSAPAEGRLGIREWTSVVRALSRANRAKVLARSSSLVTGSERRV